MANRLSQAFKHLRVYQHWSLPLLINGVMCNRLMKLNFFVDKAPQIYKVSKSILGKNLVNAIIHSTYCKAFTAGTTVGEANQAAAFFQKQGIPVILDYCAEGQVHNPGESSVLDSNAQLFADSARLMSQCPDHMISIKITGLLDMAILKKWNEAMFLRDRLWRHFSDDGCMGYEQLKEAIESVGKISENQLQQYLRVIHKYEAKPDDFQIDQFHFKVHHQPHYLYDSAKNANKVIQMLFPLTSSDIGKIQDFKNRLERIITPFHKNENNFRILVDAEQSYTQRCIETISDQLQERYNKERAYIIPTIQNYLKRSIQQGTMEILTAKYKKLKFGAKLVRGAYIVEQTRLAEEGGYSSPVVESYDNTTHNYMTNFTNMLKEIPDGEIIVATHSQQTIDECIKVQGQLNHNATVSYAQLLGLADHVTWQLRSKDLKVYKYLPWAQTEVMVPYMIRRAQELNQMKYPLDIQYDLLKHELWCRLSLQ